MFLVWIESIVSVILLLVVLQTFISHILAWRHIRMKKGPLPSALPSISIIKPVRGLDQGAEENFLSFIRSDYPAPFEVCFCVEERDDPAVPLIQRLIADAQPPGKVRLVFSKRQDQRELGKTINLIAGIAESGHEILVLSDSDVRNTPGFLEEVVRPLSKPGVGMAYACPVYREARDWAAGLMALAVGETILALTTAPPFAAIGSTIAVRRDVLKAIGGLAPIRHRIGMDAALGRAVSSRRYRIELIQLPVTIIHHHSSLKSWWQQLHRWLVTIRRYLGARYFAALFFAFPVPWATLYLLLSVAQGRSLQGLAVWGFVLSVRLASLAAVNLWFAKEPTLWRYLWLVPILDFLKIPLWVESYLNPYVIWRGRRYRVMSDATIRPA